MRFFTIIALLIVVFVIINRIKYPTSKNKKNNKIYNNNYQNQSIQSQSLRSITNVPNPIEHKSIEESEDLFMFFGSSLCPYCSIYSHRVFSRSGKDPRFPSIENLPNDLLSGQCPRCNVYVGSSTYYDLVFNDNLTRDIKRSNEPFIDQRTPEQVKTFHEIEVFKKEQQKDRIDYEWLINNLPDIAPKSFAGYRKMKKSNSKNFLLLSNKAKENGYKI